MTDISVPSRTRRCCRNPPPVRPDLFSNLFPAAFRGGEKVFRIPAIVRPLRPPGPSARPSRLSVPSFFRDCLSVTVRQSLPPLVLLTVGMPFLRFRSGHPSAFPGCLSAGLHVVLSGASAAVRPVFRPDSDVMKSVRTAYSRRKQAARCEWLVPSVSSRQFVEFPFGPG